MLFPRRVDSAKINLTVGVKIFIRQSEYRDKGTIIMTIAEPAAPVAEIEQSRVKRLKAATRGAHGDLDAFIMAAKPFESRENFGKFVETQYLFHRDLDAFFPITRLMVCSPTSRAVVVFP